MLEAPTVTLTQCISYGTHMLSFQPGYDSEGTYIEQCTECGGIEFVS